MLPVLPTASPTPGSDSVLGPRDEPATTPRGHAPAGPMCTAPGGGGGSRAGSAHSAARLTCIRDD